MLPVSAVAFKKCAKTAFFALFEAYRIKLVNQYVVKSCPGAYFLQYTVQNARQTRSFFGPLGRAKTTQF